jgi:hypothetical protein
MYIVQFRAGSASTLCIVKLRRSGCIILWKFLHPSFSLKGNINPFALHRKKGFTSFPSLAGMSLTKLPPLGRNNSVMTSLFPPRESLVVTSRLGTGNSRIFFYGVSSGKYILYRTEYTVHMLVGKNGVASHLSGPGCCHGLCSPLQLALSNSCCLHHWEKNRGAM